MSLYDTNSRRKWFVLLLVFTSTFPREISVFGASVGERSFKRRDPLNHLRYYRGGYDVTNKHYWASAAYTGIHGYVIAGIWILCGLAYGIYMILKHFIGSSSPILEYSSSSFLMLLSLVLLFSFLAIIATGLVIGTNQTSVHRMKRLKNSMFGVATEARQTIWNVTQVMDEMQSTLRPYDSKTSGLLNETSSQLGGESRTIRNLVRRYERPINKAIQIAYIVNLVVAAGNLAVLVAGVVLLLLHWRHGFIVLSFLCWIFTILCWLLTGLDFFVHTFAKDTCSALEDFVRSPQNNSLSTLLPCVEPSYSDKVLVEIGYTVHSSIATLNSKVAEFSESIQPNGGNDIPSYTLVTICNPFSGAPNYSYAPNECPQESLQIGDVPGVLSNFTCYQVNAGDCERDGRFVPEATYKMASAYSNAINDLIKIFPNMKSLLQCSFVTDSFSNIVSHQCRPFKSSNRKLWLSVLCLSVFMGILELLLVAKAYQDRGRTWSQFSIFPNTEYNRD